MKNSITEIAELITRNFEESIEKCWLKRKISLNLCWRSRKP